MPDPGGQQLASLTNPLRLNGGAVPRVVTGNYGMQKGDGWVIVQPQLATGQIQIQLPYNADPGATYRVTRIAGAIEPNTVDVVVVGAIHGASGDTLYSVSPANGGYHISRTNETVEFMTNTQIPAFVFTDWLAVAGVGLGLETYTASFVPNLAGTVTVPLAGFGPFGGDGGHPKSFYGISCALVPGLSAGSITLNPRFAGVSLGGALLILSSATEPAGNRIVAGSPAAGPGVGFFTAQPGCFLFSPGAAGGVLDVQITGAGGAAGPAAGVVTAFVF